MVINDNNLEQDKLICIWQDVLRDVSDTLGEGCCQSWFSKISPISFENSVLLMGTSQRLVKDRLSSQYSNELYTFCKKYLNNLSSIEIILNQQTTKSFKPEEKIENDITNNICDVEENGESDFPEQLNLLDPRFTFSNFIVGKPNEFAYAAALRVADSEVTQFNPLFLYGGVGLGKTHLMHAIAWKIHESKPNSKIIYLSAEQFMYRFIRSLRLKNTISFKEQLRSVDILMIDDFQFIGGKETTQEEFFHTFNSLVDNNKQVIISADKSPSDLENIGDRLKSRLGWGLVADIHPTTYELRLGILQSKIESMNINIPRDVLEFLAAKITSNVRELEGALNRIIAHASLIGRPINLESTREVLRDLIKSNEKYITIEDIQKRTCDFFGIKMSDLLSSRRLQSLTKPRQIAMFLCKILTTKSYPEIGRKFGGRDHATVIHAVKKIQEVYESDAEFAHEVDVLKALLTV